MENNGGKNLFYGVVGVATLIVAIIGATFAYFTISANVTGNNDVTGNVATVTTETVSAVVTRLSTSTAKLVPLGSATIAPGEGTAGATDQRNSALSATTLCVDTKGNKVCDVYKVVVTNTSDAAVVLAGNFSVTQTTSTNFKWSFIKDLTNEESFNYTTTLATATINDPATTVLEAGQTVAATNGKVTYYIMVWLNDTGASQNTEMGGSYTGAVAFNTAGGSEIRAQF